MNTIPLRIAPLSALRIDRPAVQFCLFVAASLLLRMATFGDPNLHSDECFYLLVGKEMHLGSIPYVDIWDRKPLGLFIAYWVFAAFPESILAYQLGACLAAALAAFFVCRIASRWLSPSAALSGGVLYLAMLGVLLGRGGQSPVFYNTLVAAGALLTLQYLGSGQTWRLYFAMLLLGSAITFKQTAAFEAAYFGVVGSWHHRDWRKTFCQIIVGAAPFTAMASWYAASGYWAEFYGAMVTASTHRPWIGLTTLRHNAMVLAELMGAFTALTAYGYVAAGRPTPKKFLVGWLAAATIGFLSVPYFIEHYALPLLVPMSVTAAAAFQRRPFGPLVWATVTASAILITGPARFDLHNRSRLEFERMARAIGDHHGGTGLLIYDGPPLLYWATNTRPLSPLTFPGHLNSDFERDLGPRRSGPELERILAARPDAVVMMEKPLAIPPDPVAYGHLLDYVKTRCAPPLRASVYSPLGESDHQLVYTRCG